VLEEDTGIFDPRKISKTQSSAPRPPPDRAPEPPDDPAPPLTEIPDWADDRLHREAEIAEAAREYLHRHPADEVVDDDPFADDDLAGDDDLAAEDPGAANAATAGSPRRTRAMRCAGCTSWAIWIAHLRNDFASLATYNKYLA